MHDRRSNDGRDGAERQGAQNGRAAAREVVSARHRLEFDRAEDRFYQDGWALWLPRQCYTFLVQLKNQPARLLARQWLVERVCGGNYDGADMAIWKLVSRLRRALGPAGPELIRTVPGLGYRWEPEGDRKNRRRGRRRGA